MYAPISSLKVGLEKLYFFGTNLVTMSENFKAEKSQFSDFWFWQLTTCQTIVHLHFFLHFCIFAIILGLNNLLLPLMYHKRKVQPLTPPLSKPPRFTRKYWALSEEL